MTEITIYRDKPLSVAQVETLHRKASEAVAFKPRNVTSLVWKRDEYGDLVQVREEHEAGEEVFVRNRQALTPALLESLLRPAKEEHIGVHLTNLAAHLPYGRGGEGFAVVIADMCRDLEGVSEYAIIRACDRFRRDTELTFFPSSAQFVKFAKDTDFSLRTAAKPEAPKKAEAVEVMPAPTDKQRRRVARITRLALKPRDKWTAWEQKFFEATRRPQ